MTEGPLSSSQTIPDDTDYDSCVDHPGSLICLSPVLESDSELLDSISVLDSPALVEPSNSHSALPHLSFTKSGPSSNVNSVLRSLSSLTSSLSSDLIFLEVRHDFLAQDHERKLSEIEISNAEQREQHLEDIGNLKNRLESVVATIQSKLQDQNKLIIEMFNFIKENQQEYLNEISTLQKESSTLTEQVSSVTNTVEKIITDNSNLSDDPQDKLSLKLAFLEDPFSMIFKGDQETVFKINNKTVKFLRATKGANLMLTDCDTTVSLSKDVSTSGWSSFVAINHSNLSAILIAAIMVGKHQSTRIGFFSREFDSFTGIHFYKSVANFMVEGAKDDFFKPKNLSTLVVRFEKSNATFQVCGKEYSKTIEYNPNRVFGIQISEINEAWRVEEL
ncbi:hypothetical protein RCL1_007709 [Eukaryota sp. TZLM3-RCL]